MALQRELYLIAFLGWVLGCGIGVSAAEAADVACPGNPHALGVSRVLTVTPEDYSRLGSMQYRQTLPLADHEVVLTFDDGPLPPYTSRILTTLAHECVKATFFMVGRMAAAYPEMARLVAELGHTIGNHSQNHPIHFDVIGEARAEHEVENGVRSIKAALRNEGTLAPFFRVPGLGRTHAVEKFLRSNGMIVWSSDTVADDWTRISSDQVLERAMRRLEAKGRGILLLHDIQPRTALALPALLRQLKARGFRIVHVVPNKIAPPPQPDDSPKVMMASVTPEKLPWPRLLSNDADSVAAITEKARQIASLGVTHSNAHAKSAPARFASLGSTSGRQFRETEPAAKHIRPRKFQRPIQNAALTIPDRGSFSLTQ